MTQSMASLALPPCVISTSFYASSSNLDSVANNLYHFVFARVGGRVSSSRDGSYGRCTSLRVRSRRNLVLRVGAARGMAPDEEKMTRRSPLDFPVEWDRPRPGRRPDIFPQFSPMKTPLPTPLPADPPEEDEEDDDKKEEEEEETEKEPEKDV